MSTLFSKLRTRTLIGGAAFVLLSGAALTAQASEAVAVKHALYGAGYDIPNVSPEIGEPTREALEAFQKDHPDLSVTGEVDEATKKALGIIPVEVATAGTTAPEQKDAAAEEEQIVPAEPAAADAPPVVTEEDDGGWSFF